MPYGEGKHLPGERASKLGHLDVLKSPLVNELCRNFESLSTASTDPKIPFVPLGAKGVVRNIVFAVDGSLQIIDSSNKPRKALGFVKTALTMIDQPALMAIDKEEPHPFQIRDILTNAQIYHASVFPLRHISLEKHSIYDAIRKIVFDSIADPSLDGEILKTLKWIVYQQWDDAKRDLPPFACPHCMSSRCTLTHDSDKGPCPDCGEEVLVTDMLGIHLSMAEDSAPNEVVSAYMTIHETLLLFTGIRYYWQNNREILKKCLFVKDGPLAIRAQYSKLVEPLRRFMATARDAGIPVCLVGQEKSGAFVEHLEGLVTWMPVGTTFVPGHDYIREEIQHQPTSGADYGKDTNYGAKVFVRLTDRHSFVLNIPTGLFIRDPLEKDLIGGADIFATLPTILSARYENALLPIELAHSVASLSTYPSASVLRMFADAART